MSGSVPAGIPVDPMNPHANNTADLLSTVSIKRCTDRSLDRDAASDAGTTHGLTDGPNRWLRLLDRQSAAGLPIRGVSAQVSRAGERPTRGRRSTPPVISRRCEEEFNVHCLGPLVASATRRTAAYLLGPRFHRIRTTTIGRCECSLAICLRISLAPPTDLIC